MKTAFVVWLACSGIVGWLDAERSAVDGDDRPWWGRAIFALVVGGALALGPAFAAILMRLP